MSDIFHQQAILHSATCFLNSLLREWQGYTVKNNESKNNEAKNQLCVEIKLNNQTTLEIPLKYYSGLGRHIYQGNFFIQSRSDRSEILFENVIDHLGILLAQQFQTPQEQVHQFKERVLASFQNIETSLESRLNFFENIFKSTFSFIDTEQGLFIGHNFHPTPKSRDQFNLSDMQKYSPEMGGSFSLDWYMADPNIIYQRRSESFKISPSWMEELAQQEIGNHEDYLQFKEKGFMALPMHPWQMKALSENESLKKHLQTGRLVQLKPSFKMWSATSSLRSIYRLDSPYMLKFSMSVKLTNSIRHLLTHEVQRGLQLRDVLETPLGQNFLKEHPQFKIITEPAYFCLKNNENQPMDETIVVCRDNPFQKGFADHKCVLATLTQDAPLGGTNLIHNLILSAEDDLSLSARAQKWFQDYLYCVVTPLIHAQANYGIILGAHQQNLIIDFAQGYPVSSYFRDCQGTGYSELGFTHFSKEVASIDRENGNVVGEKMGNYLFTYYLILNSTFNVITAIASSGWVTENDLLKNLKKHLQGILKTGVKDSSCLNYILKDLKLMHKGNFICAFKNINENTAIDPLVIYTQVPNPLKESFQRETDA
jgi:N2-citryl-N6-acetyl-N6-hydroxylysine synthase